MCGRFFRHAVSWQDYHAALGLIKPDIIPDLPEAYNVAPTQQAPIIRLHENGEDLELALAHWGLVPRWWKKPLAEKKFLTINAKSEDAAEKPTYRAAWKDRPCLVPMSGFYEWTGPKGAKQPYAISMRNRNWFVVCGLWDRAIIEGAPYDSFTILTTAPNTFMSDLHNRMPVIPEQDRARDWVTRTADERLAMTEPYSGDDLFAWKVGTAVGKVRNQGRSLIDEIEE